MPKLSMILAVSTMLAVTAAPAFAQTVAKTWVSSTTGNDTGTCQFVTPCKTFAYAITQTAPGGELDVKDSGSYGPLVISHAISVVGAGSLAAIAVPAGGIGITINAGPFDNIVLQGLTIDGHGTGQDGILLNTGKSVTVQNCQVRNFVNTGIGAVAQTSSQVHISDTTVSNSGNGIVVQPTSSGAVSMNVMIERVQVLENAGFGVYIDGANVAFADGNNLFAAINDSIASDNGKEGFRGESADGSLTTYVTIMNSQSLHNGIGVSNVGNHVLVLLAQSLFQGNTTTYTGASIITQSTNTIIPFDAQLTFPFHSSTQ